ncbi:MAG: hypothetical protein A2Y82_02775 [Candidatus Buchananbacteria bacterium RBG_13_36_9]|uniref:Uncharacterized protein n=1 Tax=Candidatus Buchananbacteria bacterium RBG_13_36_9 TaxID=1797530 RepID=A0A1G1XPA1_9BACT|nr:MAG: hypothetical protein A2Y82_02775 [Candidatus Buchananbacteria bacterium RBG_13_36_9]
MLKKILYPIIFLLALFLFFAPKNYTLATDTNKQCKAISQWGGVCKADCKDFACKQKSNDCTASGEGCCVGDVNKDKCAGANGTCKDKCVTGETPDYSKCCDFDTTTAKVCCKSTTTPTAPPTTQPTTGGVTTSTSTSPTEGLGGGGTGEKNQQIKLRFEVPLGQMTEMTITGSAIGQYIKAVYVFGSSATVALAIVMIIIGGIQWILSGGESGKINDAKDRIVKALLGMFIAIFAVFVLQTVSPGTVSFKSISSEEIKGVYCCKMGNVYEYIGPVECAQKKGQLTDLNMCLDYSLIAKCTDDLSHECGKSYTDPFSNPCVGKDCSKISLTQVCRGSATTWACAECLPVNSACTTNSECCSGACNNEKKCADSALLMAAFGQSCGSSNPCPSPLICETNWLNRCNFGRLGGDCSSDNECDKANGFYCNYRAGNKCAKRILWGRCDPGRQDSCPPGSTCKEPEFCHKGEADYIAYHCKNDGSGDTDQVVCVPNSVNCVCNCWSTASGDCSEATYPDSPKANICNEDGENYCHPGLYGSPCEANDQCQSKYCDTKGMNKNMCSQGDTGEACGDNSECRSGKCCTNSQNKCVPPGFNC